MKGLDSLTVERLRRPTRKTSTGYALVRTEAGLERVALAEVEVGDFYGRQGTIRRSRKGRTYHAPNGYRGYGPNWESDVVLYSARKG